MSNHEEFMTWMWESRNINAPCAECSGFGVKTYGSTSTWRGGIGGRMITSGVCDRCWGTGDEDNRGVSYRQIEMWKAAYDREQVNKQGKSNDN